MSEHVHTEYHWQKEELDILQSIYMDEIELLKNVPPYKFLVHCRPYLDHSLKGDLDKFTVKVEVELPPHYPTDFPKYEIKHHLDKVSNYDLQLVNEMIKQTAEQLKGEAMLFEIVESIRNWLQTSVVDPDLRPKKLKRRNMNDDLGVDEDYEDHEVVINLTKKDTYTPVTRDSFLDWKKKFDDEMIALKKAKGELIKTTETKLSGKQLFERDAKLVASDALDKEDEDVDEIEIKDLHKEESKEEASPEEKKLFYYNEELFDEDIDIDVDDV
jgi:hypothetical protein